MFTIDNHIYKSIDEILDNQISFITSNKKIRYANVPCAIDIETSSFYEDGEKRGVMYAFVIGINGKCYIGRTYEELWMSLDRIVDYYQLSDKKRMVFYIHNLSFEFQWFRKWRNWTKVFATDERVPLYALDDKGIELRCSYQLSGYSLANVGKNLTKYKVEKMVGDLDYKLIRHSETPLSDKEMGYILNDGLVVMAYIQEEIENHYNNITLLELTKTGKVRKYVRKMCLYGDKTSRYKYYRYHNIMKSLPITSINEYEQLKRAFQGGFTHADSLQVGKVINNVHSFDFTSSYPAVMVMEKYPIEKGELIQIKSKEDFERNMQLYCCIFDATFENIESTFVYDHPISISKCYSLEKYVSDNGRLVSAEKISITLTEIDFDIIRHFYSWEHLRIKNFRRYRRQYLPRDFVLSILNLYQKKTTLKGVEDSIVEYNNSKEMLNSCYGMSVTDILRDEIEYDGDNWESVAINQEEEIQKYNDKKNRFLCYQWGVWVTAYARRNLFSAIYELKSDYIYSDTDSVKFVNLERHQDYFNRYNKMVDNKLKNAMDQQDIDIELTRPKTITGKTKVIGYWDYEECFEKFKTLGAKRYMIKSHKPINYGTEENPIWINYSMTVSGVNKKYAIPYLYDKYGDHIMDEFKDGLIIPPQFTGKNIHTYIDDETSGIITDYRGYNLPYYEKSSIHLEESGYELSLSKEFIDYLLDIKLLFD